MINFQILFFYLEINGLHHLHTHIHISFFRVPQKLTDCIII